MSALVHQNSFLRTLYTPGLILLRLSGLDSTDCKIDREKLLFRGRFLTQPNVLFAIFSMFSSRVDSFHDPQIESIGVIPSIFQALGKYIT